MSRIPASRLPLLAFVALAGCATVPEEVPEIWPDDADAGVPAVAVTAPPVQAPPEPPAALRRDAPPSAPAVPAPTPKPKAKPWKFSFAAGRTLATADGVSVYLGEPAVHDRKGGSAPSALDAKATIGPLLSARKTPLASGRKMRICLDPGHGGIDSGAVSKDGKTHEKSIALDISLRVARKLRADGFEVMLTRTDDATAVELSDRADAARRWRADAFVSVHLNSAAGGSARGIETYAFTPPGMESTSHSGAPSAESGMRFPGNANDEGNVQLAFCVHRRLVRAAGSATEDRGLRRARWIVLREARCPAVLVECGFVSSAKDLAWLRSESGREAAARGIYEGICDFAFGTMEPGLPARKPPAPTPAATAPPQRSTQPALPSRSLEQPPRPVQPLPALERVSAPLPERPLDAAPGVSAARAAALRAAGLAPGGAGVQTTETTKK